MMHKFTASTCMALGLTVSGTAFAVDWQQALNDATILSESSITEVGNNWFYASVRGSGSYGISRHSPGNVSLGDGNYVISPDGTVTDCEGNMAECTALLKAADAAGGDDGGGNDAGDAGNGGETAEKPDDGSGSTGDGPVSDAPQAPPPPDDDQEEGQMGPITQQHVEMFKRLGIELLVKF